MLRDPSTHVARSTGPARLSLRARSVTCFASHVDLMSGQLCVDVWVSGSCQSSFWLFEASPVLFKAWTDKSSLVCSIFCVWMSALLLSVFLCELRKLEGLPTERCSTESQALRRGGRRWKDFCLWTRGGLPLLKTRNFLGELAQCSACWSLPRRWTAWSRWWRSW